MPYTSAQVSGLVGGQQAMFANQAAYAHQISSLGAYDGAQSPPPSMSNPYPSAPPPSYGLAGMDPSAPDLGTRVAGGSMLALPGIAAGGAMASSLLGYKSGLGLLDPFTGISRAFGAGVSGSVGQASRIMAGAEGLGLQSGLKGVAGAFSQGGLRAGLGAIGGGLVGAAGVGALYYGAGKGIEYLADSAYEGVQNIQDVRRMSHQYFTPQHGQPGTSLGGRMDTGAIKNITSFMHELASEDVMTSMKDMRRLMDKAGQMGMLQGTTDVNSFKQRFKNIVNATKTVAQIIGTTLDEAMPLVSQLKKMDMWTAQDVMGTAVAAKAAGPGGAQAMMGSMQQGAQISHAMGGDLISGARSGQQLFGQVSAAVRSGVFSGSDIKNITGGVGGAEGQRMVAGLIQQGASNLGNTAMGRVMMAGLGEIKDNEFTGRMDEDLLRRFQSGEVSIDELMSSGRQRVSNKNLAASFFNKSGRMGQSLVEQGGISGMAMGVQKVMERHGYGGAEDATQNMFLKKVMGFSQRQADAVQKIIKDLPKIQAEQDRANFAALEDSFRRLDERRNRSLSGLKEALGSAFHEAVGRPVQELAEGVTASMSESIGRFTDRLMGRTRALPRLSMDKQYMLSQAGALDSGGPSKWSDLGIENVGQGWLERGFGESIIAGLRGDGSRTDKLIASGLEFRRGQAGDGDVSLGEGRVARLEDVEKTARRSIMRAANPTMSSLLGGETKDKRANLEKVKARMRELFNSPKHAAELKKLKEENPEGYARALANLMKKDPETRKAMQALSKGSVGGELDAIAVSQTELGFQESSHAAEFADMSKGLALPSSPEEVEKFREDAIADMAEAARGTGSFLEGVIKTASIGGGLYNVIKARDIQQSDIEAAVGSDKYSVSDILAYAKGESGSDSRFAQAANQGDTAASKLKEFFDSASDEDKEKFIQGLKKVGGVEHVQYQKQKRARLEATAKRQGPISSIGNLSKDIVSGIESARKSFARGDVAGGEGILRSLSEGDLSDKDISTLLKQGGVFGKQVGMLAKIGGIGEMGRDEVKKLEQALASSGANLFDAPGIRDKVEEMLSSGGKIEGIEVGQLKELLKKVAPAALGQTGGAARTSAEEAQLKYIEANTKFVQAVSKAIGDELQEYGKDVLNNPAKVNGD